MRSFYYTTRQSLPQCDDFCFTPQRIAYCLAMRSRRSPDTTARGNLGVMASVSNLQVEPIFIHVVMSAVINRSHSIF
jgi:hypothetical protein